MTNDGKIRVLIADDSAFMRKVLTSILESDGGFEVVGEARDGLEVVAKSEELRPQVITMDLNMPHMDGLHAIEVLMSTQPRPILVVSSESKAGAEATLRALELGAIDFVAKPSSTIDLDMSVVRDELLRKVRTASKVRVVRNLARATAPRTATGHGDPGTLSAAPSLAAINTAPLTSAVKLPIVVLAASTGGPATLMKLVPDFVPNFPGALIIVQHMPGSFTPQFAAQLGEVSQLPVKEAESGETLRSGQVYVCPGSSHLRVALPGRIVLDDGPRIAGYRPSIDVTMESVASLTGLSAVAVILTGMGNDGARGAMAIREGGGLVIAQDEATSVIFGMPSEAIQTGAVEQVLPIGQIAAAVNNYIFTVVKGQRRSAMMAPDSGERNWRQK